MIWSMRRARVSWGAAFLRGRAAHGRSAFAGTPRGRGGRGPALAATRLGAGDRRARAFSTSGFLPEVGLDAGLGVEAVDALEGLVRKCSGRLAVITGAGLSTASGIPCYRGEQGSYSRGHTPMKHQEFVSRERRRKRYWARSLVGWRYFASRTPTLAHFALSSLEEAGAISGIVTQNVDRLHQAAGSRHVIDLHGRNDRVSCLSCGENESRWEFQERVEERNREWMDVHLRRPAGGGGGTASDSGSAGSGMDDVLRADGDAHLESEDFENFHVPSCKTCGDGVMMPDVVFFGGSISSPVKNAAAKIVDNADGLLILGSSCFVYSAFRLVRAAAQQDKHIALVNVGETRVDALVQTRVPALCDTAMQAVCDRLGVRV